MKDARPKPHICFVQINALGLLVPEVRVPFGGAETRALTFAQMLRDSGRFDVSFAMFGESVQPYANTRQQGMRVFQVPPHRFDLTQPKMELQNFYDRTHADCFISLGANEVSHEMARYAQIIGVPAVVGLASDQSLQDSVFKGSMILNDYEVPSFHAWEALHQAATVMVQTHWQQGWLYRKVGKRGFLVPNPIPAGWEGRKAARASRFAFDFLWVGRPGPDKNPEIIFELAREMSLATFRMVIDGGPKAIPEPWGRSLPGNLCVTDRLDNQEDLWTLMNSCRAIVNSSPMEGFPNLMLQGAVAGCPCLFLNVDPDGWATEHGCAGSAHGDVDQFLALLNRALIDPAWLGTMAERAFQRATECHSAEAVQQSLLGAMNQALESKKERV